MLINKYFFTFALENQRRAPSLRDDTHYFLRARMLHTLQKNRVVMAVLAINIDIPKDSAYNEAELRMIVTDYVNKLVAKKDVVLNKSNTSCFRKLRGIVKSDIPFEDMRGEAIRDKYGV